MSFLLVTSLDESVPLVAAVFDEDTHALTSCGGFRSMEEFERFLDDALRTRGLHLGEVTSDVEGIAVLHALDADEESRCEYLVVTSQQLPAGWREQMSAEDPLVAAFGLERGRDGVVSGAYSVGAFASSSELSQNREFAESSIKGFDGKSTFALVVPFLIGPGAA